MALNRAFILGPGQSHLAYVRVGKRASTYEGPQGIPGCKNFLELPQRAWFIEAMKTNHVVLLSSVSVCLNMYCAKPTPPTTVGGGGGGGDAKSCESILVVNALKIDTSTYDESKVETYSHELLCSSSQSEKKMQVLAELKEKLPGFDAIPLFNADISKFNKWQTSSCKEDVRSLNSQALKDVSLQMVDNQKTLDAYIKCIELQAAGLASQTYPVDTESIAPGDGFQWFVKFSPPKGAVTAAPTFAGIEVNGAECSTNLRIGAEFGLGEFTALSCRRKQREPVYLLFRTNQHGDVAQQLNAYAKPCRDFQKPTMSREFRPQFAEANENGTATLACPTGSIIVSWSSFYHSRSLACGRCQLGASNCSVVYSNGSCGDDPANGVGKKGYLEVTCSPSSPGGIVVVDAEPANEWSSARAVCPDGYKIVGYHSEYGAGARMECGRCRQGEKECKVAFNNDVCRDTQVGTPKQGWLSIACSPEFPTGADFCKSRGETCTGSDCNLNAPPTVRCCEP